MLIIYYLLGLIHGHLVPHRNHVANIKLLYYFILGLRTMSSHKLRVLCLHGNNQNKDIFRQKTGSFRKPLKKYVDFEYLNAPHFLEYEDSVQGIPLGSMNFQIDSNDTCSERRGWWLKIPPEGKSDGLKESLALFENFIHTNGPFDGIIGFSQGAAFLALACILLEDKFSSSIKFVILVAGFKSLLDSHKQFYHAENRVNIPSLHIVGETDKIISADRSKELFGLFNNAQLVTHTGGHYVPATKELRDVYQLFISRFLTNEN